MVLFAVLCCNCAVTVLWNDISDIRYMIYGIWYMFDENVTLLYCISMWNATDGQHEWNLRYQLEHEFRDPTRLKKRWVLNRIWNKRVYDSIFNILLNGGVDPEDITVHCFDPDVYEKLSTNTSRELYLTVVNDGMYFVTIYSTLQYIELSHVVLYWMVCLFVYFL